MKTIPWQKLAGFACASFFFLAACTKKETTKNYVLEGSLKKWHPITITFDGPELSETDSINPFLDYSLITRFHNGKDTVPVHGYFAADGDAGNTGAVSGNKWRVKFTPSTAGDWQFESQLLKGKEIAVSVAESSGAYSSLWKTKGRFKVMEVDTTAKGFYKTGRLTYAGKRYLEEAETGKPFLKNGVGSPENFLAYHEFDGTFDNGGAETPTLNEGLHEFATHVADWKSGDPTWGDDKGKGIIGALNYLAGKGMNSLYFLVMNEHGDGDDVWPWTAPGKQTRYDVSKLAQWEVVFTHMDQLGMAMNVFTQETENDTILNKGDLGLERKLYYKELVARFGHHLGVVWNLGEETNRSPEQLKSYASYIRGIDPYDHPIAVHNHIRVTGKRMEGRPLDPIQETLTPLLGYRDFEIPSLQMFDTTEVHREVRKWIDLSMGKKKPWVVYLDEIGHWDIGVTTDTAANNNHDMVMRTSLWGSLLSGGAGTSWYFGGLDTAHNDMAAEDFRARNQWWETSNNARVFFQDHLPFWEMKGHDELVSNEKAYCFAKKNEIYVVYLPKGETTDLEIGDGAFTIAFYDPKGGGKLYDMQNSGWKITKPNSVTLSALDGKGDMDWVIVIMRK
ncbi:DUF5060 domain-containing protein [Flavobacteriaceae bacterium TP-CH-4]|uniref:DUF5060 domain-containing protein n=1 Tax=Pelagihabitans pacificus TaxID=2696054 RepID=A0A967EDN9_9FLAO|nr:DUF5060 domain-containing protein [Pelagihabitans pacificus]NHF59538.1 DUF5060 domain-containing protein [Pelagihabitans pacificus]